MSRTKKEIPAWAKAGHSKPVTRRDFLAHGLIPFAASAFMPNWFSLLAPQTALAEANCPAGGSSMIPFVQINLEGGAGLAANYVPLTKDRQLLPSYSIIGLGDNKVPIVREFGNAPFATTDISFFLRGLKERASADTINKTAFIGFCTQSRDDSRENNYAINGLIHRAGLTGTKLPTLGNRGTKTGINQNPVVYSPPSPLIVGNFNDIANAMGFTASLNTSLNVAQKQKLTKLIGDLNGAQARKLASINSGKQIKDLIDCAGIKNSQLIAEGAAAVDPRSNASVASIWGLAANTAVNNENLVLGSMVYNTLIGQAGSTSFSRGGYDYHGSTRAETSNRDLLAGAQVGRVLQTANALNKPVFIMVTTDGAVSAQRSDARDSQFVSDRGQAGMAYVFMFDPAGRPATTDFQVGHYTAAQSVDTTYITGNSPELTSQAIFLNYLKLNNKIDLYKTLVPNGRNFDAAGIAEVVKVA